jgi:hypothetical protein
MLLTTNKATVAAKISTKLGQFESVYIGVFQNDRKDSEQRPFSAVLRVTNKGAQKYEHISTTATQELAAMIFNITTIIRFKAKCTVNPFEGLDTIECKLWAQHHPELMVKAQKLLDARGPDDLKVYDYELNRQAKADAIEAAANLPWS